MRREWFIYIPDEGDWPINYTGTDRGVAKRIYLRWAGRKRLPNGSWIWSRNHSCRVRGEKKEE